MTIDPLTVRALLERSIERSPHSPALVTVDVRWTYRELHDAIVRSAGELRAMGVGPGTAVACSTTRGHEALLSFFATMWLGGRWVGINPKLATAQRARLVTHSGAEVVLVDPDADGAFPAEFATAEHVVSTVAGSDTPPPVDWPTIDPHAPAAIAYTSGTSGEPKGVVHSQHNITLPAQYLSTTSDFAAPAVIGLCLPPTVLNAIGVSVLPAFAACVPVVVVPAMRADTIVEWVERECITTISVPPPVIIDLATRDDVDVAALASLTSPRTGGAALSDDALDAFEKRFGLRVMRTYGLTEAPTVVATEPRGERLGSTAAGRLMPYLRGRATTATGSPADHRSPGDLWISGATEGPWAGTWTPMLGYWRDPVSTEAALVDGWTRTGDLGWIDDDGVLFVTGRASGVINRGGTNVHASDVETVLRSLPGVLDAAVVGVPDPRLGERVAAAIVLREGPESLDRESLVAECGKSLARYEVPEIFLAVEELPRNDMGKVLTSEVRRLFPESAT